jgi:hypothetical protein
MLILFIQKLNSSAKPLDNQRLATSDQSDFIVHPLYTYYTKVLSACYSRPFDIDENKDMDRLLRECLGLVNVSEYLGCVDSVSHTINAALLGQGQILFRSVAAVPFAWVSLALRVRSVSVLIECVIHLTGQWNSFPTEMKEGLDPKVRELCQKKHEKLHEDKKKVECNVLKYYPPHLTREIGAPPSKIARMSYSNDIMHWMALSLFRHWFASALALDRHRHAKDGGYWLYSRLAAGGTAYLSKSELKSYHEKFPMSTRGENVMEENIDKLKDDIKVLAKPLMKNESQLDCDRFPVHYTTCVRISREEVFGIWADEDETPEWAKVTRRSSGKAMMKPPPKVNGMVKARPQEDGIDLGESILGKRARVDSD